jgi:hypothetical protein
LLDQERTDDLIQEEEKGKPENPKTSIMPITNIL